MKSLLRIIFFSLLIASSLFTAEAQDFNRAKLDSLFRLYDQYDRGMGSISLFQDGEEVYQNSIGYVDVEKEIVANANTQYRIGSITKMFTAVLFMKMVESNKLSLDQKLSDFYPEVPKANKISFEQMLRHRSGIFNIIAAEDYFEWMEKPISEKEMVQKIATYESQFEPGSKAEYSNANYILLTYIIEQVSNRSYRELLKEFICDVCDLQRTEVGDKIEPKKNEALSYLPGNPWAITSETDMSVPIGAGAMVSTPTDLNRFLNCLYNNGLVEDQSLEKMMELKDNFGLGMFTVPFYDLKGYGHTGGIDGFNANAFYIHEKKFSISYTANAVKSPVNDLMIGVLSIFFGMDYELPEFRKPLQLKTNELKKYEGVYSSADFPLKVTIIAEDNQLKGQASGQPQFILDALGGHKFQYERAGLELTFKPKEDKMILEQRGGHYELTKE